MRNKEYEEIMNWLNDRVECVLKKFGNPKNTSVFYNDILSFEIGKLYPLVSGCNIKLSLKTYFDFELTCYMDENVTLYLHNHPDFIEGFEALLGSFIDEVTGRIVKKFGRYSFPIDTPHQIRSLEKSEIKIKGKRVKILGMNLQSFFKDYPEAKLLQVGEDFYLSAFEKQANQQARIKQLEVKTITVADLPKEDKKKKNSANTAANNTNQQNNS